MHFFHGAFGHFWSLTFSHHKLALHGKEPLEHSAKLLFIYWEEKWRNSNRFGG